jgi:hypothetical protein
MRVKTPHAGSLRFPEQRQSSQGESGAKPRLRSVGDAQAVHILLPPTTVWTWVNTVGFVKSEAAKYFRASVRSVEGAVYGP